ncbi:MAG: tRNA1(Val) (adenine(37)-N6)-methyltransferase [Candidatus Sericytochromatia bacterium]
MSYFRFRLYDVHQDRCGHRVGTDAMLLGAWAGVGCKKILDVGTGTGVLALMLAQRAREAMIDAIDIDLQSVLQARENVAASPWPERIRIHGCALQDWEGEAYDLIVCNPPYYTETTRALGASRHQARHTDSLQPDELLVHALRLLGPRGRLAAVLPLDQGQDMAQSATGLGFHLQRCCQVRHSPAHPPRRLLLELGREPATQPAKAEQISELAIRDGDGGYSPTYRALTEIYHSLAPPPEFQRARAADFQR